MFAMFSAAPPLREQELVNENQRLRRQLDEANSILNAIRNGEVDAFLAKEEVVYVLNGADRMYRMIVEQMQEGYVTLGADGTILFCNKNFAEIIGMPLDKIIGSSIYALLKVSEHNILSQFLAARTGWLKGKFGFRAGEVPVLVSASHISMEEETFVCMVVTGLSERERFENEITRLEKLNMIGEMAAGIGHEIRNPLTTVRGYLQMFRKKEKYAEHWEQFATMIGELDRANSIITEYLALAKNKAVELSQGNLNNVVNALFPLIEADAYSVGQNVKLETSNLPDLKIDERELRQLLLNLVRNGLEAMKPGGTVTIKTYYENDKVILAVQDTGQGVPKVLLDKLGTPFLTTKEKGTGLGLAVCYRIAQHHGAEIDIQTSPRGTTFSVSFKP